MPRPITYVALSLIGRAIHDLSKPRGERASTSGTGIMGGLFTEDIYATGCAPPGLRGEPPRLWPEVIDVTEALIGSALVVAQAHLVATRSPSAKAQDLEHVANYWKHRGDWGAPWGSGLGAPHAKTLAAIQRLVATPPVARGQLRSLVETVLGKPFDVDVLWDAIA